MSVVEAEKIPAGDPPNEGDGLDETKTKKGSSGEWFKWTVVTLVIPLTGFVWNQVEKHDAARREVAAAAAHVRQKELEEVKAKLQADIESARSESDIVIKLLPALSTTNKESPMQGIALAVLLNLAGRKALSADLLAGVQYAIDATSTRIVEGQASAAERTAMNKIATDAHVDGAAAPSTLQLPIPRVYVQIFEDSDRGAAQQLQRWCSESERWLAPGIENVVATATRHDSAPPKGTDKIRVIYFNGEDSGRAETIAGHLRQAGSDVDVQHSTKFTVPSGQLEVWFPDGHRGTK